MYRYATAVLSVLLSACATPMPAHDPGQAWVELYNRTGKVLMAERLDGERLNDGRYFQVSPGSHELLVRFDYEISQSMLPMAQAYERTCYLGLRYDAFQPGQRYRLEARNLGVQSFAFLYNAQGEQVATERRVNCLY